jgi:hypothetical protein
MLPSYDTEFLNERSPGHLVVVEAGMTCITIPSFSLPPGLDHVASDLLLRLSSGYPDVPPDMWWFAPGVRRADGAVIDRADVNEFHLGREWQRWSRHLAPNAWRSGIDGIRSYLALVDKELLTAALRTAA